jgi:predicted N-formylglutamate amidohydrolase
MAAGRSRQRTAQATESASGRLVLSCEHATNRVPPEFAGRITCSSRFLASHRGYDAGAAEAARALAKRFEAPLFEGTLTRLLIDLNRPEGDPNLYSRFLRGLAEADRARLLARYHRPHWDKVRAEVERRKSPGLPVVHVSVHSFTPELRGERRQADIGFLFDAARVLERRFCAGWRAALEQELAREGVALVLLFNSPYAGDAPALTTSLRERLPKAAYLGIEIEINQRLWRRGGKVWQVLGRALGRSLSTALGGGSGGPAHEPKGLRANALR